MITLPDFSKKQIVFVLFGDGEKMAFHNDNLIVKDSEGAVKFQITCYRLFVVFAIGNCSLTSVILQKARKYGFYIALMTSGFRLYGLVGAEKDGNTLLKKKQYSYSGLEIAEHITKNKILNQRQQLQSVRTKNEMVKEAVQLLSSYSEKLETAESLSELLAYEGLSAKLYFRNYFSAFSWNGRLPRVKRDIVNSSLDIGYTLLFTFMDALLSSFGFDTYCGVMHTQFYMRKSLVCDIVEPFRCIIDRAVKNALNLKQIQQKDFTLINGQYKLNWKSTSKYIKIFMLPLIERKDELFKYVREYYRAFMKGLPTSEFPVWFMVTSDDYNKL